MKDIFKKEKREMIEEIIVMENYIYNDMLKNLYLVDYYELLHKYDDLVLIYKSIKEVNNDRNCS